MVAVSARSSPTRARQAWQVKCMSVRGLTPRAAKPILRARARILRNGATPAEVYFWKYIRCRRFRGLKFRRQHALSKSILDFYCPSQKLCIEVDGGYHCDQVEKDARRDAYFKINFGLDTIRFTNEQVFANPSGCLKQIAKFLDGRSAAW